MKSGHRTPPTRFRSHIRRPSRWTKGRAATNLDAKEDLRSYLSDARDTLVWKLDDLSEYDIRRPLTPTGTNLLGLVKHSTASHLRYFGEVFGRSNQSSDRSLTDAGPDVEFFVRVEESKQAIVDGYREAGEFAEATIGELDLDSIGMVPWWGDAAVTLHHVMVHVTADTQRHAGHADILREQIDGSVGLMRSVDNIHISDPDERSRFWEQVEAAAARFR